MVFGAVYINLTKDKKLFRQINNFTPPVMSIFFIISGMNLDVGALQAVGAVGVSYFLIRIVGKYLGTYISCLAMGTGREIRNYMGLALIPQAGVAIGLAFLGQRVLPPETGSMMLTIILASSVLYEMVGPVSAKAALFLSGSISYKKEQPEDPENPKTIPASSGENERPAESGQKDDSRLPEMQTRESDSQEEEEEDAAILPQLRDYSRGVDESDDYDIEKNLNPRKNKKKKKAKKQRCKAS